MAEMLPIRRDSRLLAIGAGLVGLAAVGWQLFLRGPLQVRVERHFAAAGDPLSEGLAVHRIHVYGAFLAVLALALLGLAVALRSRLRLAALFARAENSNVAGVAAVLVVLLLGAAGSTAEWRRFGEPCWDDYCGQADVYRAWLAHPSGATWAGIVGYLQHGLHSNSPVGPVLTALLGNLAGVPTITAYRVVVGLATLLTLAVAWLWLLPRAEVPGPVRLPTLLLLATSLLVVRSALFPQTDALIMLWFALVLGLALERIGVARAWHLPVALVLLGTGLLVKVSFVPALALVPMAGAYRLWAARQVGGIRPLHAVARLALEVVVFGLVPLAALRAFQLLAGSTGTYAREISIAHTPDTWAPFLLETFLQAALLMLVLFALGWSRRRRVDLLLAGSVAVYVVSLLVAQASGFDRYLLPVVPPLALLASRGLECLAERDGLWMTWVAVMVIAALNYTALALGLYV